MLELGTFLIFNLFAFGLLFYGNFKHLPMSGILHIVSMVVFFGLGFMMLDVQDIGTSSTVTDGTTTWTETTLFMGDNETDIFVWIYFGMATIALISFMATRAGIKMGAKM